MNAEIVAQSADDLHETADSKRWFGLAVIVAAQFMVVLDVAIVNVALPSIKTDLGFSQESLQWVITGYSIFFGGFLLLGGRLADLLGRRRLFMAGLLLFTVSSLLNGIAWSEASLIAFRCLQGLGAAMLSPAALSILTTTFEEGRERNRALGIWGAVAGSGGAAGVLLGGVLTSAFSWPWIFYVNVPVGAAVLVLSPWLVRESRADLPNRYFDFAGAATTTAFSAVAQGLVTKFGVRSVLPVGLALSTVALVLFAQLPVHGHYFTDLFPGFIISGLGLGLVFVPMSIGALTGVREADAGIASGLINTTQQIGGAIGVAAATTIATTFTSRYLTTHPGTADLGDAALTHGFQVAFYGLAGLAALGA